MIKGTQKLLDYAKLALKNKRCGHATYHKQCKECVDYSVKSGSLLR